MTAPAERTPAPGSGSGLIALLRRGGGAGRVVQSRDDRLWIRREGEGRVAELRRRGQVLPLGATAWADLLSLLGIPAEMPARLATLRGEEECRLVNMLLWARGAGSEGALRLVERDGRIVRVRPAAAGGSDPTRLADALEAQLVAGTFTILRWGVAPGGIWLVAGYPTPAAFDLAPGGGASRPDLWQPAAMLLEQPDGHAAATVLPGLYRQWGRLWLPLDSARQGRSHRGESTALADTLVGDLVAARGAAFGRGAEWLRALQGVMVAAPRQRLPRGGGWTGDLRTATLASFAQGRPSAYRLVAAALRAAYTIEDPARRLAALLALRASADQWRTGAS